MYVSWCYIFFVILLTGTTHYDETFPSRRQHRPCRCVDFRLMQSLSYPSEGKRKHGNTSTRYLPPNRKGGPRKGARSGTGRLSAEHPDPERLTVLLFVPIAVCGSRSDRQQIQPPQPLRKGVAEKSPVEKHGLVSLRTQLPILFLPPFKGHQKRIEIPGLQRTTLQTSTFHPIKKHSIFF